MEQSKNKISTGMYVFILLLTLFVGVSRDVIATEIIIFEKQYYKQKGRSTPELVNFSTECKSGKCVINNGTDAGGNKANNVQIILNGETILDNRGINRKINIVEIPVKLLIENTLSVLLKGRPGSYISVKIIGNMEPVVFFSAEEVDILTRQVGVEGDTVVAPDDSVLAGLEVYFPPGSILGPTEVTLSSISGSLEGTSDCTVGMAFALNIPDQHEYEEPIFITIPYDEGDNSVLSIPFYVDSKGMLSAMNVSNIDVDKQCLTFQTFHNSYYIRIDFNLSPGEEEKYVLETGFSPGLHGFQIGNFATEYSSGQCFGMASLAYWYFCNETGLFHSEYMNEFPDSGEILDKPVYGQHIIASRAQLAGGGRINKWVGHDRHDSVFDAIYHIIRLTSRPVLFLLHDVDSQTLEASQHTVLAYAIDYLEGKITVYDSNYPGVPQVVSYDRETKKMAYKKYDTWFAIMQRPTGGFFSNEPYYNILVDAQERFKDSACATIEILSHKSGEVVSTKQIAFQGIIHSAAVLVDKLTWYLAGEDKAIYTGGEVDIDLDGKFNLSISLEVGENNIFLVPKAKVWNQNIYKYEEIKVLNNFYSESEGVVPFVVEYESVFYTIKELKPPLAEDQNSRFNHSRANALNNSSVVVGSGTVSTFTTACNMASITHAIIWDGETRIVLDRYSEGPLGWGTANDINNSGIVVGEDYWAIPGDEPPLCNIQDAGSVPWVWSKERGKRKLETTEDLFNGGARKVDENGIIEGYLSPHVTVMTTVFWDSENGNLYDGYIGPTTNTINSAGQRVATPEELIALLGDNAAGLTNFSVIAINDLGEMIGNGSINGFQRGFIVYPPDNDGDRVGNATELKLGLNPNNEDSDGDGIHDGDEISMGTDPSIPEIEPFNFN